MPLDGSSTKCLATNIRYGSRFVSWAPNGKHLIYTHPDGLFLTSTQGDEQKTSLRTLQRPLIFLHVRYGMPQEPRFSVALMERCGR